MSFKGNIKKLLFVVLWCMTGAGVMVLLVAAINKRNGQSCKGYEVRIDGGKGPLFISQAEVVGLLTDNGKEKLSGRTIISFDLRKMEDQLKKNVWIREAQLFFDNNERLRVRVTEREPVARIFTVGGANFYMDSSGMQLPLSDKSTIRLPVFTSFPSEKLAVRGQDSLLICHIGQVATFILRDSFWMAQVGQVDILPSKTFEMVPVVGNHLIEFGDGSECRQKFDRLMIFYREVLSKTGFDKYTKVDVRFSGQVVGTKKGNSISRADSVLAVKNIERLIRAAQQLQFDSTSVNIKEGNQKSGEVYLTGEELQNNPADSGKRSASTIGNMTSEQAAAKKKLSNSIAPSTGKEPKAVMKKKGNKTTIIIGTTLILSMVNNKTK